MVTLTRSVLKYKRGFFVRLVSALVPKIRNIANDLLQEIFIVKLTVEGIFDQRVLLILKFEKVKIHLKLCFPDKDFVSMVCSRLNQV